MSNENKNTISFDVKYTTGINIYIGDGFTLMKIKKKLSIK